MQSRCRGGDQCRHIQPLHTLVGRSPLDLAELTSLSPLTRHFQSFTPSRLEVITPKEYVGPILDLLQTRRGE